MRSGPGGCRTDAEKVPTSPTHSKPCQFLPIDKHFSGRIIADCDRGGFARFADPVRKLGLQFHPLPHYLFFDGRFVG